MATEPRWTLETYRLDEIARKFDLPCVVCVTEGFYSATEAEGFSQGDIISIDSRMILHKVAANFAKDIDFEFEQKNHDSYVDLRKENEILVPLNYKGKLRVLKRSQNFDSVRELAVDFPRYAKLRQNLTVEGEGKPKITITAGTVIELDRILPGGAGSDKGKLVVQFMHMGKPTIVALPLGLRGKFQTEPDRNEYTVKEAIDRYSLPQTIRFVDDEIKRVYTQDLVAGIENMTTITETLRLNRLVTQEVLVGHFKPAEGTEDTDTERFRQRTLVVLPIDNPDIRDIEVNVLLNVTEDFYSDVFLVRNVSRTEEIVDGSLYIDFVTSPGIKRITDVREDPESTQSTHKPYPPSTVESPPTSAFSDEAAPPIPPRQHGQYQNRRQSKSKETKFVASIISMFGGTADDAYEPVCVSTTPSGSSATRRGSTTTPIRSPTTSVHSPTTPVGSATTPVGSPTTPLCSHTAPAVSSTKSVHSPTTPLGSPTSLVGSSTSPAGSPTSPLGSRPKRLGSSTTSEGSPTKRVSSQTTSVGPPTSPVGSPTTRGLSSATRLRSRSTPVGSPTSPVGSPTSPVGSPTLSVGSPTTRLRSRTVPVGSPSSSVKLLSMRFGSPATSRKEKTAVTRSVPVADDSDGDEYEPVSSPTAEHAVGLEFTLAGISFDDTGKKHGKEKKKGVPAMIGTFFHKRKVAKIKPGKKDEQANAIQPSNPAGAGELRTSQIYDEVDELKMNKLPGEYDVPSHPRPIEISGKTGKKSSNIPVARVSPSTNQKHFFDLTMNELVERLTDANLTSAANMCQKDNLNGSFFKNMSKDEIQGIFELTKLELIKFMKMKDENWVPTF